MILKNIVKNIVKNIDLTGNLKYLFQTKEKV